MNKNIEVLEKNGFRWSRFNGLWWSKYTAQRWEFINELLGEEE